MKSSVHLRNMCSAQGSWTMESAPLTCLNLSPFQSWASLLTLQGKGARWYLLWCRFLSTRNLTDTSSATELLLDGNRLSGHLFSYWIWQWFVYVISGTGRKKSVSRRDLDGEGPKVQECRLGTGCWERNSRALVCQAGLLSNRAGSYNSACLLHHL